MTFRKLGSRLEGHPTPMLPWVDVATGSLGQALPIAVGIALAGKRPLPAPYHVWTIPGDSELAEDSIWEGLDHAGHEGLTNFTAIFDVNRLGQRGPTEFEWDLDAYAARVRRRSPNGRRTGNAVDEATALHAERDGRTFYFCSDHCQQKFLSTPAGAKPGESL